jgi:hypothetical protein
MMADPLLAQSAVDRLISTAHGLIIEGESRRRRQKPALHGPDRSAREPRQRISLHPRPDPRALHRAPGLLPYCLLPALVHPPRPRRPRQPRPAPPVLLTRLPGRRAPAATRIRTPDEVPGNQPGAGAPD